MFYQKSGGFSNEAPVFCLKQERLCLVVERILHLFPRCRPIAPHGPPMHGSFRVRKRRGRGHAKYLTEEKGRARSESNRAARKNTALEEKNTDQCTRFLCKMITFALELKAYCAKKLFYCVDCIALLRCEFRSSPYLFSLSHELSHSPPSLSSAARHERHRAGH